MAEAIVGHARARARAGDPDMQDTAIAMRGALPQRQRDPDQWVHLRGGNLNRNEQAKKTMFEIDSQLILKLSESARVDPAELCSYRTPQSLLLQGDDIDPLNVKILGITNDASKTRRTVLDLLLQGKAKSSQMKQLERKLAVWPAAVQQLHGEIEELGGVALKIPAHLLTPVRLLC